MSFPAFRMRLLVVAIGASLAACTHTPVLRSDPVPKDIDARVWSSPELTNVLATLPADPAAVPGALSTTESLAAALAFNPELTVQRAQAGVARAELAAARQRKNPIISIVPEHLISAATGVSPWVVALSLVWPLRTNGKRELEIEQALATSDSSLLSAAGAIWSLRATARADVCALELATARAELTSQEAALRADLATRLAKQADAGLVSRYDATRTQLERDQALQRARQGDADLHTARFDLADLTGLPLAALSQRTVTTGCLDAALVPVGALPALRERALGARLDLRAKLADYRAADAGLRAELARRFPDIDLAPGYTYDQGDRRIALGISGELPFFARNNAAIARATAQRMRVAAEVEKLQWTVRGSVDRALDQLQLREAQYADAQRIVTASQDLLDRDRERMKSGELDQPSVIATELNLIATRLDALTTRQALLDAVAALEAALQTPLVAPFFDDVAAAQLLNAH